MEPTVDRMAPGLRKWCESAKDDDRRSVVVRPVASADIDAVSAEIRDHGGEIQSAGAGAITMVASARVLLALARLPWVRAIEEPRRLFPKSTF